MDLIENLQNGSRPAMWRIVRQAIEELGGNTTNKAIVDWVLKRYPNAKKNTIQCQILSCCVNIQSRVNWPENAKPRKCTREYDFLYKPGHGLVELYDPEQHGDWELCEGENGKMIVRQISSDAYDETEPDKDIDPEKTVSVNNIDTAFAAETHLRDYLSSNLSLIEQGLELYVDENDKDGVEYQTGIGRIDILAIDKDQRFVVIELKVARGPDYAAAQVLRYKNWVKRNMADGNSVRGIIIAQHISDKILYAIADDHEVTTKQYELSLKFNDIDEAES